MATLTSVPGDDLHSSPPSVRGDLSREGGTIETSPENTSSTLPTKVDLLESINSKILPPEIVLEELALLRGIHKQLRAESTKTQFVWNAFLQITGIVFVVVFGVFSIIAYKIGERANMQASEANQLALLAFCFASNSNTIEGLCGEVLQRATQTIPSLVTLVMGSTPVETGNSPGGPIGVAQGLAMGDKLAISVGTPSIVVGIGFVMYIMWGQKFKEETPPSSSPLQ